MKIKKILAVLVLSVAAVVVMPMNSLLAQERFINIYLDADSGNILHDNEILWGGNSFDVGIIYGQNFASLEWLSVDIEVAASGSHNWSGTRPGSDFGTMDSFNGFNSFGATLGVYADGTGFGVDGLALAFNIDTDILLALDVAYGLSLGNAGDLAFGVGFEFFPGTKTHVVDNLFVYVDYAMAITENFWFGSYLELGIVDSQEVSIGLSWENKIGVDFAGGFGMYAGLGLDFIEYADNNVDLRLLAGVSYNFDL